MSIEQNQANVLAYAKELAKIMHLADWDIRLDSEMSEEGSSASIGCVEGRKIAMLSLGRGFFEADAEDRRHTITHELVHIHLWGILTSAQTSKESMGISTFDVFWKNLMQHLELGVDGLADGMAPLLPTMEDLGLTLNETGE